MTSIISHTAEEIVVIKEGMNMRLTVKEVRLVLMACPEDMEIWIQFSNENAVTQIPVNTMRISPEKNTVLFTNDEEE